MRLLEDLRALGFEIEAIGDKVRVRHRAPDLPEVGRRLLDELRQRKAEVLAALTAPLVPPAPPPVAPRVPPADSGSPWPPALPGLGPRTMGPFETCVWCGAAGAWARYAGIPTCLGCTRRAPQGDTPEEAKAMLHGLLTTRATMDESRWTRPEVAALFDAIVTLWEVWPGRAEGWFDEWRAAHPEARPV